MKKQILLLLLGLCLLGAFASCGGSKDDPPTDSDSGESGTTGGAETTGGTVDATTDILLWKKGEVTPVIVLPQNSKMMVKDMASALIEDVQKELKLTMLTTTKESEALGRKILVRMDAATAESAQLGYSSYCYRLTESGDLEIVALTDLAAREGLKKLRTSLLYGEDRFSVSRSILGTKALSKYDASVPYFSDHAKLYGLYDCGENDNYRVNFTGVTAAEYRAYEATLVAAGYEKKTENDIVGNLSAGYVKDKTLIWLNWSPSTTGLGITYGKKTYIPETSSFTEADRICETTLTQIQLDGGGLCLVYQLGDGTFVIFDGGTTSPAETTGNLADRLLAFLQEKKPEQHEKPIVAAWILTHGHEDHITAATDFFTRHNQAIELRMAAFNFGDHSTDLFTPDDYGGGGLPVLINKFRSALKSKFPLVPTMVVHTGQRFTLADVTFEVLNTHEDTAAVYGYVNALRSCNHACAAYRVTVGDTTAILLGDTEVPSCKVMVKYYGDALKSDILQAAHHGLNGATLEIYQAIDPDIVIWPCSDTWYASDMNTGVASGYEFNKWIRDDSIKKRQHYTSSYRTEIKLPSLEVTKGEHDPSEDKPKT